MADDTPTTATPIDEPSVATEEKLPQTVDIRDAGPCRKHIKVTIDRRAIDERFQARFSALTRDRQSLVAGFRPGKAPRKIIEKRYSKEVGEQVKAELLMASLEQIATDEQIAPLAPPEIDPGKIVIPSSGPMIYEFEVEVRPEFDLPDYKGLKLKRPVQTYTDADLDREEKRLLEQMGQVVPKPAGASGQSPVVELGDLLTVSMVVKNGDEDVSSLKEVDVRVDHRLVFRDAVIEGFAKQLQGAKVGDQRTVDMTLSDRIAVESLRGKTLPAQLTILDIKTIRLPEITPELLKQFGATSREQLRELIRASLDRRLEYLQRQSARTQVLELLADASQWELPRDLLMRQARRTLARRVMEMRSSGMSDDEILARQRMLEMDVLNSTAKALKEHFVLQKIATIEKIEINDDDIDDEINRIADRSDESPRRVRARLERDDLLDTLATELLERKALDLVLQAAEYEDVPLKPEEAEEPATPVEAQVTAGELTQPLAESRPSGE